MSQMTRRRFLRSLGLGAGASLLMPLSDRLVSRALGMDTPIPKRLVLFNVYMLGRDVYEPADAVRATSSDSIAPYVPAQWPSMFAPLGAYMNNGVFVQGVRNWIATHQHRAGTAALSCVTQTDGKPERMGPAGGVTIDQHIADTLSASSAHKSVLWGLSGDAVEANRKTSVGVFASGREQNLSHFTQANEMLDRLFPDPVMGEEDSAAGTNSFRPLRDRLVGDLGRLKGRLASEEIIALESYEQAILEFDERQEALSMLSCGSPPGAPENKDAQDHLESMMSQTMLALQCGLTNVVGITIGTSNNHNKHMPAYREVVARSSDPDVQTEGRIATYGHGSSEARLEAIRHLHELHMRELARVMDGLSNMTEADGSSIFDHTAFVYSCGNGSIAGATHHAGKGGEDRWPVFLVAGERTGFDTGGRFMGCSLHNWKGERWSLTDVYQGVAAGLGVDPTGFGDPDHTNGPFEPILK